LLSRAKRDALAATSTSTLNSLTRGFEEMIYIAALLEYATKVAVGKTWMRDRKKMMDLSITDRTFAELQQQLEARLPGHRDKAISSTARCPYVRNRVRLPPLPATQYFE